MPTTNMGVLGSCKAQHLNHTQDPGVNGCFKWIYLELSGFRICSVLFFFLVTNNKPCPPFQQLKHPMVQLPAELWAHIASYLTPTEFRNTFAYHPVFLDLYLGHRYKSAVVSPPTLGLKSGSLHLGIATRVRQMVFNEDPPALVNPSLAKPPMRKGLPSISSYREPRCENLKEVEDEDAYFHKLKECIPPLQNVHSLDITIKSWGSVGFDRFLPMKMQFFVAWSKPWAANLTHINLDCDLCLIHPHWPKDIIFPNLSSVVVRLHLNMDCKREGHTDFLRPLIVNHSGSLTTLGLKEKATSAFNSTLFLLEGGIVLPKLEKLIIGKNISFYGDAEVQQVIHFMKRHARTLKELSCIMFSSHSYSADSSIYGHHRKAGDSILDYDFPKLETLTLSSRFACFHRLNNSFTIHYAHRPLSRLRSLTLKTMILSRAAVVKHLFSPEALSRNFTSLTHLSFAIECLDVELLVFLATSLNQLEYLSIRLYRDIRGPAYGGDVRNPHKSPQVDTTEFRSALINLDLTTLTLFSSWNLRKLDLVPFFCNTQLDPAARKALIEVLPNVHSFCEMGREEYATVQVDPGEIWSQKLNYFDFEQDS
ncbi:hypothetical protein BJ165DRAFT_1528415 [Panaeolus papilionaceus]|nr:hypothetical protein BJ165DRAFT_1528415 [Panaeolus papilionaceus]